MTDKRYSGKFEKLISEERKEKVELERVVEIVLEGKKYKSMLDIGTGGGIFAEKFKSKGLEVAGIDCNKEFLELVKERLPDIEFKYAVAEKLPFDDNSFDLAFMGHVFHEVDNRGKAMSEAYRVVNERLAILEWPFDAGEAGEYGPPISHRVSKEDIFKEAQKAGFTQLTEIKLNVMSLYIIDK